MKKRLNGYRGACQGRQPRQLGGGRGRKLRLNARQREDARRDELFRANDYSDIVKTSKGETSTLPGEKSEPRGPLRRGGIRNALKRGGVPTARAGDELKEWSVLVHGADDDSPR